MLLTVDFHERLVQMPPQWAGFHAFDPTFTERQRETNVHHNRQADNLTTRFEVAKWVRFGGLRTQKFRPACLKLTCFDSSLGTNWAAMPLASPFQLAHLYQRGVCAASLTKPGRSNIAGQDIRISVLVDISTGIPEPRAGGQCNDARLNLVRHG